MLAFVTAAPYAFFFLAAALLTGLIAWRRGTLLGWTLEQRVALFAAVLVGANIGSRWLPVEGYLPQDGEKTIVGALVGAAIALGFALRALGMGLKSLDAAIPAVPIGMAIGRVGCFIAGCCFGTSTTAAWGATYPAGSVPFATMVRAGLLDPNASATAPLHPAQLYEAGFDLGIAMIVITVRGRLRAAGSAPLLYLALYAVGRFAVEFVRFEGVPVGGLKPLQWALLAVIPLAVTTLLRRERAARNERAIARIVLAATGSPAGFNRFALSILVAAVISIPFASPVERVCFQVAALLVLLAIATRHRATGRLFAPVGALALFMQGPVAPSDATRPAPDSTFPRRWFSLGAAANSGRYVSTAFRTSQTIESEVCGPYTSVTRHYRDHETVVGGVSGELRRDSTPERGGGIRGSLFAGSNSAADKTHVDAGLTVRDANGGNSMIIGGRLVGDADARLVGISVGAVGGRMSVLDPETATRRGVREMGVAAVTGLRVKLPGGVRLEYALNDVEPAPLVTNTHRGSISYRFTKLGTQARYGVEATPEGSGSFASVKLVLKSGYEIEPAVVSSADHSRISLTLKRRFGLKP